MLLETKISTVTGKFFIANIEVRKKILRGMKIHFLRGEFSLQACSLEPYLTVCSIGALYWCAIAGFHCKYKFPRFND